MTTPDVRLARPTGTPRIGLLTKIWLVWFLAYMTSGTILGHGFFSGTVDRIDSRLIHLSVLNIPLQLSLIIGAELTALWPKIIPAFVSRSFAAVAVGLALIHFSISLATWW